MESTQRIIQAAKRRRVETLSAVESEISFPMSPVFGEFVEMASDNGDNQAEESANAEIVVPAQLSNRVNAWMVDLASHPTVIESYISSSYRDLPAAPGRRTNLTVESPNARKRNFDALVSLDAAMIVDGTHHSDNDGAAPHCGSPSAGCNAVSTVGSSAASAAVSRASMSTEELLADMKAKEAKKEEDAAIKVQAVRQQASLKRRRGVCQAL